MSVDEINDIISLAEEVKPDSPEPLRSKKSEPVDFPIEVCTPLIRNAILSIEDKIQAPTALCAQSVLATANLAVQGHANIQLPHGGIRPISCFFLSIAKSGERKTSCDNEVLKFIRQHESSLREEYNIQYPKWKNKSEVFEKQKQQILADKNQYKSSESKEKAIELLGRLEQKPLTPILTCPDPTVEGLFKLMVNGQPSLGIFSSEGGQFIGGYGMKEENKIKTAASLCDMWDGNTVKRIRSGDGVTILNGRRLCMHLMVQPKVANKFLCDEALKDQGLLSRILTIAPRSNVGNRFYKTQHDSLTESSLKKFGDKIIEILNITLPTKQELLNELAPRTIVLDSKAKEKYKIFYDEVEKEIAPNGKLEIISGFANKLPEHAVRIAATFLLMDDINSNLINEEYMNIGIGLAKYYCSEILRITKDGQTDPNILLAEHLLNWLHNTWGEEYVSLPDIYQSLNALSKKSDAERIVRILENHGWMVKIEGSKEIKGKSRKDVWRVIKET